MSINCQGPCLVHCYYKNSIVLLLIGFLIGLYAKHIYYSYCNKHKNEIE